MWLEKIAPKSFLCRFPLKQGAIFVGIFSFIIAVICVLCLLTEIFYYKQCKDCTALVLHNAYGFSINSLIFCIGMVCVNGWFIWGAKRDKSSVVLSWVVISAMWWLQSFFLVLILLCMYITDTSLGWIVALICAIIAFMLFGYFIAVVYGYWLEIRKKQPVDQAA